MITVYCLLNCSTYILDLNSCAVLLDNLAGTSYAVVMGHRLICSHCFLTEQHYENGIRKKPT